MTVALQPVLVSVPCPGCGVARLVTPHTVEKIRVGKASGLCLTCGKENGPSIRVTPAMRRYWLDRYTVPQIVEMAEALFGPRSKWPETHEQQAAA